MKKLQILSTLFLFAFASAFAQNKEITTALQKTDKQFFIENKGQWDAEILYMTSFAGLNAFITKKGIVYDFYELKEVKDAKKMVSSSTGNEAEPPEMEKYGHMIRINLLGCNENASPLGKEKSKTYYNYLIADDTAHSRGHVGLYKEVALTKVYDHIDMRYYFEGNSLRYDYILKPGANVSQIKMQLEGSDHSYLNSDGEWIFETRFGEVKNTKLLSYQIIDGEKKVIPSEFKRDVKGNITFELGAYDDTKELVIDPLVYSTFIGGHDHDYATAIIVDDSGQVYMVGRSLLFNGINLYPVTPGAYVLPINGNPGLYEYGDISKFSADGSTLLFSTTFNPGSVGNMRPSDIELGLDKSINVAGYTSAMGFYRGFFLKLTPDGAGLLNYQQYEDSPPYFLTTISSMRIDSSKATFFTGSTLNRFGSPIWPCPPITDTFFHDCTIYWSASRAFVAKLDSSNNIVFSSSFGGSANGKSIEIDSLGNVYVVGDIHQANPNFPYPSSNDSTFNGGSSDVFLAKYNPNGVLLNFSYLGG